jgi:hypothetical protein
MGVMGVMGRRETFCRTSVSVSVGAARGVQLNPVPGSPSYPRSLGSDVILRRCSCLAFCPDKLECPALGADKPVDQRKRAASRS